MTAATLPARERLSRLNARLDAAWHRMDAALARGDMAAYEDDAATYIAILDEYETEEREREAEHGA